MKISFIAGVILIMFSIIQCRYFNVSPVDGIRIKNLKEKPENTELFGSWEIDKESYDYMKTMNYLNNKSVTLILNSDQTFIANNFPDFLFSETIPDSILHLPFEGTWKINKDYYGNWVLDLSFDKNEFYKDGMSIFYDLYKKNDNLIIWAFIGDPDSGERFLFMKK